jgi:hypothetical protein
MEASLAAHPDETADDHRYGLGFTISRS